MTPRTAASPRRRIVAGALGFAALVAIAGCTVPVRSADSSQTVPVSSIPVLPMATGAVGTLVVTVPGYDSITTAPTSAPGAAPSTTASSTTASSAPTSITLPGTSRTAVPSTTAAESTAPDPTTADATTALTTTTSSAAPTVQVRLANCDGCTVIATRAQVVGNLAAALVALPGGRAALVAVRQDGSVASIIAVPYGTAFSTPAGGALPCDTSGRCLVVATDPDGNGIGSAWAMGETGTWTDVSLPGGFLSTGAPAQVVDLDGEPGMAVVQTADQKSAWAVFGWNDDGYAVVGCAPGGGALNMDALSMDNCLS